MTWKLSLFKDENDKLVTDENGEMISGKLKLAHDLALDYFDKKGQLPKKPEDVSDEDWFEKGGLKAEIEKIVSKEVEKDKLVPAALFSGKTLGQDVVIKADKRFVGSVTMALFPEEVPGLLSEFNLTGIISKVGPNRHSRRANTAIERRINKGEVDADQG